MIDRPPYEVTSQRPLHLNDVADQSDIVEEGRYLAIGQSLDGQFDHPAVIRRGGDGVAADSAISVRGCEMIVDVLPAYHWSGVTGRSRKLVMFGVCG